MFGGLYTLVMFKPPTLTVMVKMELQETISVLQCHIVGGGATSRLKPPILSLDESAS